MKIKIKDIIIKNRIRKDFGDIESLKKSILELGLLQPIVIDKNNILIAGERRLKAVQELGFEDIEVYKVDNVDSALKLLQAENDENTCRKDFTITEMVEMGQLIQDMVKEEAKERQGKRNDLIEDNLCENFAQVPSKKERAIDIIAKSVGSLSGRTYEKAEQVIEAAKDNPIFEPALEKMNNTNKVDAGYKMMKQIKKQEDDKRLESIIISKPKNDRIKVFQSSIKDIVNHLEAGSIDVIVTDPPYPEEYLYCWEELAIASKILLKPGGNLVAMSGHSYIPIIHKMLSSHLTYRWEMCYLTPGGQVTVWPRKAVSGWKPILVYTNGEILKNEKMLYDVVKSEKVDKEYHEWGQSISGLYDLIEKVSNINDVILDPFCGGGSTGIACIQLNRVFIGSDVEIKEVNKTIERLEKEFNE